MPWPWRQSAYFPSHPARGLTGRSLTVRVAAVAVALALPGGPAVAKTTVPQPVPRPVAASPTPDTRSADAPPLPTARPLHAEGRLPPGDSAWRTTLAFAEDGDWAAALAVPGRTDDAELASVLTWLTLLDDGRPADFAAIAEFLTAHPNWPGEYQLELRAERLMPGTIPASARVLWFRTHPPRTTEGRLAYLDALATTGATDTLVPEVRRAWRELDLGNKALKDFLDRYGKHLRPVDHQDRLDEMLWRGKAAAATRTLPLVSDGWRRLADARIRLREGRGGVDRAIEAVPVELRDDPGLLYERIRWRRQRGMVTGARDLLFEAPPKPEFEALWWRERSWHIREALDAGNAEDAYLLAASHVQRGGVAFAEAEWLAGWIALRFLDRAEDALRHFRVLYENVSTPISLGRAAYWAGRAAEALGDAATARAWYGRGAEQPTTFYGQLAAARLGATEIALAPSAPVSEADARRFHARDLVRATEALIRIDRRKLAERFLRTLAYQASSEADSLAVARLAARSGYTSAAVYAARRAARGGASLIEIGYPILDPLPDDSPEPALVHAIIRQESGFDADAVSRVGARGLMQLMPGTAKQTARTAGVEYDLGSLIADPNYNVRLGRTYLNEMIARFNDQYVLAIAAYNAGPHRVNQWIARYGHPASPDVDVIDWIEKIPFSETRNYVQRVLEGLHVYRGRLPRAPAYAETAGGWRPQAVWCVYSCGVLLDGQQAALPRGKKQ
ncbi:lytic transglycosylase [Thalassobaculum fulvum]|uniref:Lytic transglycosylase n=1 Tax=Thalassobaculum fulvum TaxID=1633335 RepID=A0A918XS22_9PROT|nr:lytic transglycosylase domain-containing protein [Thalassobaculum fulvum]GHD48708.1 lytic transglycosylase [Thalassobaculum fulvum]